MKNRIKRFFKSRKEKIGLPPGTLKFIGEKTNESTIEYVQFNASTHNIEQVNSINDITINNNNDVVNWIKISGLNVDIVEQLGKKFNFHNLMLEDILNTDQRPKIDDFKDYIYFVLKKHRYLDDSLSSQQISFILTPTFVITIEEDNSGLFNPILERIKNNQGYICTSKSDYLLYALIDVAIDNYFTLIEKLDEKIENARELSMQSLDNNKPLIALRNLKDDLNYLRKYILPTKEAVYKLERLETELIGESTDKFLRDLYDHINIISENLELYKDTVIGIREDYISNVNLKMNNVIQLLTIVSSVFIPLTFIAGVYGMNFKHMPELETENGYFIVLGFMALVALILLLYYKIKKWV
jgi:magnesium transporter